jgi:hypothetical protein
MGYVVRTNGKDVFLLCAQEKWDKAKAMIQEVADMLAEVPKAMARHRLEVIRGLLNHVFQTYHSLVPFLIGFHRTIDLWLTNRNSQGWKLTRTLTKDPTTEEWQEWAPDPKAPDTVAAVPRLAKDIHALQLLMYSAIPPLRKVGCSKNARAYYGFCDALGPGFGASFEIGEDILSQYGQWTLEVTEK